MTRRAIVAWALVIILCTSGVVMLKGPPVKGKKDPRELIRLGLEYQDLGDKNKALKSFKDAAGSDSEYPQVHFFLGRLYFMMQEEDAAISEFTSFIGKMKTPRQAMAMDIREYTQYLNAIVDICGDLKRYAAMKEAIGELIALDPKDQNAYYNLGVYYYNAEHDRAKAYQNFKKADGLDPNTSIGKKARYAIEFMRNNPDSRVAPDLSFINQEYK